MSGNTKVAIIGTVGLPACYGGFETFVKHLVRRLGNDYDMTVYCSGKKYSRQLLNKTYENATLKYLPFGANGGQSVLYDSIAILNALFFADILLIMGVSGAWLLPFIKIFTNKRIIISIDGTEWKSNKRGWLAKRYFRWAEKMAIKYSNADISDNESIGEYTAAKYGVLSNIIEYGANHTISSRPTGADKEAFPFLAKPYACKVDRVEPENNVHVILEAFSKMNKYPLVVVGNWNASAYSAGLKEQYKNFTNLLLLDPVYDQRKLDLIRSNAYIYIHGHSAAGTNSSLIEAMYLGLPVVAYDVSYNRATTEGKAFYFKNEHGLINIIQNTRISEFKNKSVELKEVADRRYTWEIIAEKYDYLFQHVLKSNKKILLNSQNGKKTEKWRRFENGPLQPTPPVYEKKMGLFR